MRRLPAVVGMCAHALLRRAFPSATRLHTRVAQQGPTQTGMHAHMSAPPPAPPCLQVKAVDAHLTSGGGAIRGSVTGVDVRLRSGGGPVQLRSLVGKQVELSSGGGAVTLGACYADQLHLQSGE